MKIKNTIKSTITIIIILVTLSLLTGCMTVISDGEVGVKKTLGNVKEEELLSGLKIYLPLVTSIEKVNVKTMQIEEHVAVPSKEGLIVQLDTSVIIKIKTTRAAEITQTVSGDIIETLVKPYVRNGIRDIAAGYEAKAIYSESGREEISGKLLAYLSEKLGENVVIEDALLRDVKLPDKVRIAIENKIDAEQRSQAKEFELVSAIKDAEIEIERAKGIAQANEIIANSISENYIKYKFIEGLNDGNTEVIYVPTEANIPILEATRRNTITTTE